MIQSQMHLYERKVLSDREFPIQVFVNSRREKGQYFDAHWHEHIELHYVVRGATRIELNQETYLAQKGSLVIANSNVLHAGFCDGIAFDALVMIFNMEDLSAELAEKNLIFQPMIRGDRHIDELMLQIYREQEKKELGWRLACKGALLQLIPYLARRYVQEMLTDRESMRRRKNLERLNTVLQYIQEHYGEDISNSQLAGLIHVSPDRFSHLFRESMGAAPLQYINEIRLKKAMNLLKNGDCTAAQAADAVGFSDYNHFGRMFRRFFGCTPMEAAGKGARTGNM
ncbi:MAG: AraC family transcriptional regulator [Eubacteriales bacterium]|nr:AraC family transcriptional regulator [Eubacteriales bacterium]